DRRVRRGRHHQQRARGGRRPPLPAGRGHRARHAGVGERAAGGRPGQGDRRRPVTRSRGRGPRELAPPEVLGAVSGDHSPPAGASPGAALSSPAASPPPPSSSPAASPPPALSSPASPPPAGAAPSAAAPPGTSGTNDSALSSKCGTIARSRLLSQPMSAGNLRSRATTSNGPDGGPATRHWHSQLDTTRRPSLVATRPSLAPCGSSATTSRFLPAGSMRESSLLPKPTM